MDLVVFTGRQPCKGCLWFFCVYHVAAAMNVGLIREMQVKFGGNLFKNPSSINRNVPLIFYWLLLVWIDLYTSLILFFDRCYLAWWKLGCRPYVTHACCYGSHDSLYIVCWMVHGSACCYGTFVYGWFLILSMFIIDATGFYCLMLWQILLPTVCILILVAFGNLWVLKILSYCSLSL